MGQGMVIILLAFKETPIFLACSGDTMTFGAGVFVPASKYPLKEFDPQVMSVDHNETEAKRFWARSMAALLVLVLEWSA